jgi:hypothetical protein
MNKINWALYGTIAGALLGWFSVQGGGALDFAPVLRVYSAIIIGFIGCMVGVILEFIIKKFK